MPEQKQEQDQTKASEGEGEKPKTFEGWLAAQGDDAKQLYEEHVVGLKSALKSERDQRKAETADLLKQLREATKSSEEGSKARKALEDVTAKLEGAEQRASFYEDAVRPEIGCANPKLAFLAAQEIGAVDAKGRIHWDDLKAQFPELFRGKQTPAGNAGAGTGTPPAGKLDMNAMIRRAAGRE